VFPKTDELHFKHLVVSHAASGRENQLHSPGIKVHLWVTDSRWGEEFKWTLNNRLERLSVCLASLYGIRKTKTRHVILKTIC